MRFIGNILWILIGGCSGWFSWILAGCMMYLTVIGIPLGRQCFKFAKLALFPFGKRVIYSDDSPSFVLNLAWIVLCGWELCLFYIGLAVGWYVTIVGIPFGNQCLKMAKLSLMPFGASIEKYED